MARRYTCVPDAANVEKGALLWLMYELENRVVAIYIELVRTTGSVIKCLHVVCIKRSIPDACLAPCNRFLNQLFVRYRSQFLLLTSFRRVKLCNFNWRPANRRFPCWSNKPFRWNFSTIVILEIAFHLFLSINWTFRTLSLRASSLILYGVS